MYFFFSACDSKISRFKFKNVEFQTDLVLLFFKTKKTIKKVNVKKIMLRIKAFFNIKETFKSTKLEKINIKKSMKLYGR